MARAPRTMRLTAEHVARVFRAFPDEEVVIPGATRTTDEEYDKTIATLLASGPQNGEFWFFAYGSLIWKPACEVEEFRIGTVHGWHRAFCLGWNDHFRGSPEHPGLMLALDRGGACKGVLYRVPGTAIKANFKKLLEREMGWQPTPFPPRWVTADTAAGPVRALTFCIDRHSGRYVTGLSDLQIADVLARAVGSRGSMAEYLFATVQYLEQMGIHDKNLWTLQALVAERIDALYGGQEH